MGFRWRSAKGPVLRLPGEISFQIFLRWGFFVWACRLPASPSGSSLQILALGRDEAEGALHWPPFRPGLRVFRCDPSRGAVFSGTEHPEINNYRFPVQVISLERHFGWAGYTIGQSIGGGMLVGRNGIQPSAGFLEARYIRPRWGHDFVQGFYATDM
jgi:hypothetical protein